jgi:hypothetical protein
VGRVGGGKGRSITRVFSRDCRLNAIAFSFFPPSRACCVCRRVCASLRTLRMCVGGGVCVRASYYACRKGASGFCMRIKRPAANCFHVMCLHTPI